MRVFALATLALLAGCLDGPAPVDEVVVDEPMPEPFSLDLHEDIYATLMAGTDTSGGGGIYLNSKYDADFSVPNGSTQAVFKVAWSCGGPQCGLYVHVNGPGGQSARELGGGAVSFTFDDPAPGMWQVRLAADGVVADMEGAIEVNIEGERLPDAEVANEGSDRDPD